MPIARRPYGGVSAVDRVAARRARLMDATLAIIGEHGVAAVTVDLICSEAQLGKRYFYESFADRDTLLVALADDLYTDIRVAMEVAMPDTGGRRARSEAVVRMLLEVLGRDSRRARLYAESAGHPALGPRRAEAVEEFTGFVCSVVLPPPLLPGETETTKYLACRLLVSGTTDIVVAWLSGEIRATPEEIVRAIVDTGAGA
ncbi:TetR/AcrR family transcriptional regulator [Nocardioides marmoribigeumensis]|jgi:AcrR family transcriptional regulator|uniref:AcrR family transcriptional regulator n=1 Tax=Nocardioides marmoribigeumensis TaxID=433649 RepID=A0ABU2BQK7_9ACTN|nr:TetR/AcrR family transcriptional regulator [Nocardioides marmoribigeumensis]MDR7360903.1 AcrR family transcriptional regulator [Nocardioides marmoribigeumensis]